MMDCDEPHIVEKKAISVDPTVGLLVVELADDSIESIARAQEYLRRCYPDVRVLVVPRGTKVHAACAGGVYHRETLGI